VPLRNQYNAASGEKKTKGFRRSEDYVCFSIRPPARAERAARGGHGQCDEAGFRAAENPGPSAAIAKKPYSMQYIIKFVAP